VIVLIALATVATLASFFLALISVAKGDFEKGTYFSVWFGIGLYACQHLTA